MPDKLMRSIVGVLAACVTLWLVPAALADFGVESFENSVSNQDGSPALQAGAHPYQSTTTFTLSTRTDPRTGLQAPDANLKDVAVDLPAGFTGDPLATPVCQEFQVQKELGAGCPRDTQVGIIHLDVAYFGGPTALTTTPVYNLQAPPGVPARFGFNIAGVLTVMDASVRAGGDYGITVTLRNTPELIDVVSSKLILWGVPADPSHDVMRCTALDGLNGCDGFTGEDNSAPHASDAPLRPFLTNPSRCGEPLSSIMRVDSWANPDMFATASDSLAHLSDGTPLAFEGCDQLVFEPSIDVLPQSHAADSPTGLDVDLRVPQVDEPGSLASPPLKKVVVRLPAGIAVNPSAADGLGACSSAQIALGSNGEPSCPDSSKIGTVEAITPLLADPLEGSVYLASQGDNPFGSLLAVYLVVQGPGFVGKFPGKIDPDPVTGRLTATFDNLPQVPLSKTTLSFYGGPRAPLVTPSACGSSTTESVLEGWHGKSVGLSASYSVDCSPGLGGFSPSFTAGTTNNQAGAFSPFTLMFSRADGEQNLSGVNVTLPKGLIGKLAGIPLCPEAQASAGTCSDASRIGSMTAAAGAGPDPLYVQGKIFLTGGYNGGAFGEAVVIPAVAGPFNLGNVVVRGAIRIDPVTAQATVVSDPFPQILQGIPLRTRMVNVTLDRLGFIFNPTNCEPLSINGTLSSAQGATANVSSHFQAANCAALGFHPSFKVSTKAKTSKAGGAFLDVKVTPGAGQANLGKVAVSLPKQLPSRLTTIQQACPEATFAGNPALCPVGSNIGVATATTPVLANPVSGPVYLVSHGGAAFPDLVMVLQGEDVTARITGSINIKNGVTSSAFDSVPDIPITAFELSLPQGPHSALGSNLPAKAKGSLCGQSLVMPTTLTGQNGAVVKQSTKIAVAGCPKATRRAHGKKVKKHTRRAHGKAAKKKPKHGKGK